MPRRGSLVGDAYVRIHADSSAIDRALKREMDNAGKKGSKEFIRSWDKNVTKEANAQLRSANQSLIRGTVGGKKEWDRQFKVSGLASVEEFAKAVEDRFKRIQSVAGGKGASKTMPSAMKDFEAWAKDAKIAEGIKKTTKAILEQEKAFKSYEKNIAVAKDFNFDFALSAERRKAIKDANQALVRGIVGGKPEWDKQFKASGEESVKSFAKKIKRDLKQIGSIAAESGRPFDGLEHALRSIDIWAKGGTEGRVVRMFKSFQNGRVHLERFSEIIGKAFGKGSRNNFLNFTGSVASGIAKITGAIVAVPFGILGAGLKTAQVFGKGLFGVLSGVGQLLGGGGSTGLTTALMDFGGNLGALAKTFGGALLTGLQAGLPVLLGIGGAIAALGIAIPPVLSFIASLAAILTSVVSTIAIGLSGAFLAVGPLLATFAAAFAAALFIMKGFGDESKKVKKALKPLTDAWVDLKKALSGKVLEDVAKQFAKLAPVVKGFVKPLLVAITEGIGEAVGRFGKIMDSPGMKKFLKVWEEILPPIFDSLAASIANFAAGLVAFFTPILPFAMMLAENLEAISQTFLEWTQSAQGQNSIAEFMRIAWERAGDLWDIIVLVGEALGALFTAGDKNGGDTIIDKIKGKLEEFVAWLTEGDGTNLSTWLQNGVNMASQLWQSFTDISTALKGIDWQSAATNAQLVIDAIGKLVAGGLLLVGLWNTWTAGIGLGWQQLGAVIVSVYNVTIGPIFSLLLGAIASVQRALGLFFGALSHVPGFEWADEASKKLYGAADATDTLSEKVKALPDGYFDIHVGLSGEGAKVLQTKMMSRTTRNGTVLFAAGGILDGPTFIRPNVIAGEAGREAVVPLDRPLAQVDPSVRALAAFAQGQTGMKSGGLAGGSGTTIEAGAIVVQSPYADPALVAESVFDHLAAAAR